jgi:hypothetical protein
MYGLMSVWQSVSWKTINVFSQFSLIFFDIICHYINPYLHIIPYPSKLFLSPVTNLLVVPLQSFDTPTHSPFNILLLFLFFCCTGLGPLICSNSELTSESMKPFTRLLGLLAWGLDPSLTLSLHSITQRSRTRRYIHAPRGVRTRNYCWAVQESMRPWPDRQGHQHSVNLSVWKKKMQVWLKCPSLTSSKISSVSINLLFFGILSLGFLLVLTPYTLNIRYLTKWNFASSTNAFTNIFVILIYSLSTAMMSGGITVNEVKDFGTDGRTDGARFPAEARGFLLSTVSEPLWIPATLLFNKWVPGNQISKVEQIL